MKINQIKLRASKTMVPVTFGEDERNMFFSFSYNRPLLNNVKMLQGARYYGFPDAKLREYVVEYFKTDKVWSAPKTPRNLFYLQYLLGQDPYAFYKQPWNGLSSHLPLAPHQEDMAGFSLARRQCIIAGDMGVGKTLAVLAAIETLDHYQGPFWYVAPRFVLDEAKREFDKWHIARRPNEIFSYGKLRVRDRKGFTGYPQILVLDEAHALKDPASIQSRAAQRLADACRAEWGDEFFMALMTGTPSPQDPTDWWSLCEIVRPGYLAEVNIHKFRERLAVMHEVDHGMGPHKEVLQWLDREGLCGNCGRAYSPKQPKGPCAAKCYVTCCGEPVLAKNEVKSLYERLANRLVFFAHKKDVLNLPDLKKTIIRLEPEPEVMDLARGYVAVAQNGADALNILRQLSDGFRYENVETGRSTCSTCDGSGELAMVIAGEELPFNGPCPDCNGEGFLRKFEQRANFFGSPKYDVVGELLDSYSEHGRAIVAAGFTGTVDHLVHVVKAKGWNWIRCDGKGWDWDNDISVDLAKGKAGGELLDLFNTGDCPKLCLIGNPASIGAGLNLQKSRCIIVVSNSFNAKDRIQLENRIHRPGMDVERGGNIYDIFYLPSDEYTLNKVEIKRARQDLSMGLDVDMNEIEALFGAQE